MPRVDALETVVEGEKVRLRPAHPDEARKVFEWITDPEVAPFWGGRGYYRDFDDFGRDFPSHYFDGSQLQRGRCFVIEARAGGLREDWQAIGIVVVNEIYVHNRNTEIDIAIGERDYRDKGYGTEAMRLLVRFLFNTVKLHRVWLSTYEHNWRARRAYEKVGFVCEGVLRESDWVEDKWVNMAIYGLLDHEFLGRGE